MKKNKGLLRKVTVSVFTLICFSIIVVVSILIASRNMVNPVDPDNGVNLNYDLTKNNISVDDMDFVFLKDKKVKDFTTKNELV